MTGIRRMFPRPLVAVMLRPTSVALLLLAVGAAAAFAFFGQWQLSRAVENGQVIQRPTETALPLAQVAEPRGPTRAAAVGQLVFVSGAWVAGDFTVLRDRLDRGRSGYWTVGHFRTDAGNSLPVALGWTSDRQAALDAAQRWNADPSALPGEVMGRYQGGEPPTVSAGNDSLEKDMAAAAFVNEWRNPGPMYTGYVTLRAAPQGLASIYSPPPQVEVSLNFLNLFYAAEWVLFSGAALYIWYRLMRDVYERERDAPDAAAHAEGAQRATVD